MLFDALFSGNFSWSIIIPSIISSIIIIFFTLPLHEWAHAFVATKLGDPTPGYQGRLTLNPFAHIDYFGALTLIFLGVGWAKPVQVNSRYFKNIKRDMLLTAAAGPIMNLLIAFIFMLVLNVYSIIVMPLLNESNYDVLNVVYMIVYYYIDINVYLAIFNLIPIPPFDGSRILFALLPVKAYLKVMEYERYFKYIVLILIFSSVGSGALSAVSNKVFNALWFVAGLPFGNLLG